MTPRTRIALGALAGLVAVAPAAHAQIASYNFETTPVNTPTPFSLTDNGVTATFAGPAVGVCDISTLNFAGLSGRALIQGLCVTGTATTLQVSFSQSLSRLSFNIGSSLPTTGVGIQAFQGMTLVGSVNFVTSVPSGRTFGEAFADINFLSFNRIVLTPASGVVALDNMRATVATSVIPEPTTVALLGGGLAVLAAAARRRTRQTA